MAEVPEGEAEVRGAEGARRHHEECYACPIGSLFLTARAAGPETFEHLLNAAAELVQAARAVVEAAERVIEQQRVSRVTEGGPRVRPIAVD